MQILSIPYAHAAIWKERGMLTTTETVSQRDEREIALIVLGIAALIGALAGISYGVIADHITTKKT
jgi:hypothetical protein